MWNCTFNCGRIRKVWFITNFSVCLDLLPQGFGEGESYKIRNENAASPLRLVQKGLKLYFSYKIHSWYVDVDAEMFDQYVWNVKLLGYLINLLQDAKQGPVINVSAPLLNMYKYANMQHSTNFWTDWCEVRLEICIALFFFFKAVVIYWCTSRIQITLISNNIVFAYFLSCSASNKLQYKLMGN